MLTIRQCDKLSMVEVTALVDFDRTAKAYRDYPRTRWNILKDYVPDYDWAYDISMGDIFALVTVRVDEVTPGEQDWNRALQYESTQQYIEWFKEGHVPPPIFVLRHVKGHIVSLNRRRWLAAREAGVETLPAYYSPTSPDGRATWSRKTCMFNRNFVCTVYPDKSCCECNDHDRLRKEYKNGHSDSQNNIY